MREHRLHIWGNYACFPRVEFQRDLISYDALSPVSARGILDAIHWRPAVRWEIRQIAILTEPRFQDRRLAAATEGSNCAVESLLVRSLVNVSYLVDATLTLTEHAGPRDTLALHQDMFERRARRSRFFRRPYLGLRDFPAQFTLLEPGASPVSTFPGGYFDLGWLPYDARPEAGHPCTFFHAVARDGVVTVPSADSDGIAR